ncbi:hypothetical protein [Sphingomonas solaris]|uniref:Uncharacterized protein n=1 Tax=Alterirhizorhabdus solaris TaxID=2529389 RepID=A0A558R456_9SPHN|nr:hypothetical protein [Sphingomonas solaris]TVV74173.1 hypothetical protein FOY91_10610 [Sphingomonas solaris]
MHSKHLADIYRDKVGRLTSAFEDEGIQSQAFERLRALIETVVLTPEDGELAIILRGELASMLELTASVAMQNAPSAVAEGALQVKMVAGTRFHLNLRASSVASRAGALLSFGSFRKLFAAAARASEHRRSLRTPPRR